MNANDILKKHEDANEMHFHEVDRKWIIQAMKEYAASRQLPVSGSGLPIHATNEDNTYTFCGLKVTPDMSFHRGGIMLGMIIGGEKFACNRCLSHCH